MFKQTETKKVIKKTHHQDIRFPSQPGLARAILRLLALRLSIPSFPRNDFIYEMQPLASENEILCIRLEVFSVKQKLSCEIR